MCKLFQGKNRATKNKKFKSIDTIYQQQRKCENCSKEEVSKSKLFDIEFQKQKLANSTKQILKKQKNIETVNLSSKKRKEL